MADAFAQIEPLLRERFAPAVRNLRFKNEDPGWAVLDTFLSEQFGGKTLIQSGTYPAGYQIIFTSKVMGGGRVTGGKINGNTVKRSGKNNDLIVGQAADAKYLDPTKTPMASYIQFVMNLKRIIGQVTMNRTQYFTNILSQPVEDVVAGMIEDGVARVRHKQVNEFWGDGTASIATTTNAETVVETAGGVEVEITVGSFARFQEGDIIVFGSNAEPRVLRTGTGTLGSTGEAIVISVNERDRTIQVQSAPSVGSISVTAGDHIMLAGNYDFSQSTHAAASLATEGIESLIRDTGVYPGSITPFATSGLDVEFYSGLRGFVFGNESSTVEPSEDVLAEMLDTMYNAGHDTPPIWIAEQGVWSRWRLNERNNHQITYVPNGTIPRPTGTTVGLMLQVGDKVIQSLSSARCRTGAIHGLSPETFRKFMPGGKDTVWWLHGSGPLANSGSIFQEVADGVQATELARADYETFCQIGNVEPRANFRYVGLKTTRDAS